MANPHHHLVSSTCSSFCYSNHVPSTQTYLGGTDYGNPNPPDIYSNLAHGVDMIGFHPSRHDLWKSGSEYVDDQNDDDGSSLRASSCVYPCEGHERPRQGLSLSLSNYSHHSSLGVQALELHHHHHYHHDHRHGGDQSRYMTSSTSKKIPTFDTTTTQDEIFIGKSVTSSSDLSMEFEMMRSSKYLLPSQELLNEFANLGETTTTRKLKTFDDGGNENNKEKKLKNKVGNQDHDDVLLVANDVVDDDDDDYIEHNVNGASGCSSRINVVSNNNNNNSMLLLSSSQSLYGLNLLELQKRKTKLLAMLEELDRRYKHYNEQMKGLVSSFEAIAGPGSANVYSSLASKVMSRHFRCLRDAIVAQIKATKKAIGDKDVANSVLGTTKGETPRLRMLDQAFRQQKALQQMTMIESHPWRPQRGLPERSVSVLRAWLFEHFLHPYPSDVDKHILARQTGLSRSQVSNWFINARVRLWKPMVEQMYQEEAKDHDHQQDDDNQDQSNFSHDHQHNEPCLTTTQQSLLDQKPTPNQLLMRIEPETLSSIVNTPTTTMTTSIKTQQYHNNLHESQYGRNFEAFGSIENLDFPTSSYGPQAQAQARAPAQQSHVSLTLGLQQHGGNGVSLASFSPTTQGSLFYGRDHIDHQYSLMDGDQTAQNSPYRNLMGAQLLHDFAS